MFINLTGKKFGKLRVIKRLENRKDGTAQYLCSCDCGKERITTSIALRKGKATSCGCDRVSSQRKASNEDLINSYLKTHSVWETAKEFGMCGQSVHERLTKLGVINKMNVFTAQDYSIINDFYNNHDLKKGSDELDEISKKLKRTKQFISRKAKDLGLTKQNRAMSNAAIEIMTERSKEMLKTKGNRLWKQGKRTIGGKEIYFRSRWEYNYALYLEYIKTKGLIKEWEYESTRFVFEKIKRGTTSYLPDFTVTRNDNTQYYIEIKGWMYASGATKLKRMAKYYPDVELFLIDKDKYKIFQQKWQHKLNDWE